jgi:drug/metabolite transporter (DMT)-like permease
LALSVSWSGYWWFPGNQNGSLIMTEFHALLYVSVAIAAISQVILKKIAIGSMARHQRFITIFLCYLLLIISLGINVYGLQHVQLLDMAFILPLSFIVIPILSYLVLGEMQSKKQMIGTAIIFLGIAISNF